jgi:hypothetical protein
MSDFRGTIETFENDMLSVLDMIYFLPPNETCLLAFCIEAYRRQKLTTVKDLCKVIVIYFDEVKPNTTVYSSFLYGEAKMKLGETTVEEEEFLEGNIAIWHTRNVNLFFDKYVSFKNFCNMLEMYCVTAQYS